MQDVSYHQRRSPLFKDLSSLKLRSPMNEYDLFNVEACGKCLHNLPSQRLMLKTLDKLKNTKQDKM